MLLKGVQEIANALEMRLSVPLDDLSCEEYRALKLFKIEQQTLEAQKQKK